MRIAICDDEPQFLNDFCRITGRLYQSLDILTDSFTSGSELLRQFRQRAYDLVFLDIETEIAIATCNISQKIYKSRV